MKYVIIDTETTGLDSLKHELLSIGAIVYIDDRITETLELKILPERLENADPKALEINGYSKYKWKDALQGSKAFWEVWLPFILRHRNGIFVAHNMQFDRKFIMQFSMKYYNEDLDKIDIPAGYIDTRDLARSTLAPLGCKSMSLDNICEFLGWERRASHTALSDCEDCLRLIQNLSPPKINFILKIKARLKIKKLIRFIQ